MQLLSDGSEDLYGDTNSEDAIQAISTGELDPDETMAYVTYTTGESESDGEGGLHDEQLRSSVPQASWQVVNSNVYRIRSGSLASG